VLFQGDSGVIRIPENGIVETNILMQQKVDAGTVDVTAPWVSAINQTGQPSVGRTLHFAANVQNAEAGDTFKWTSSCDGPSIATDVFSAPPRRLTP
jgi:hypothetical protein